MFFPEGPINDGDTAIVGFWDGKNLYVLTNTTVPPNDCPNSTYALQNPVTAGPTIQLNNTVVAATMQFLVAGTTDSFTLQQVGSANFFGWVPCSTVQGLNISIASPTPVNIKA